MQSGFDKLTRKPLTAHKLHSTLLLGTVAPTVYNVCYWQLDYPTTHKPLLPNHKPEVLVEEGLLAARLSHNPQTNLTKPQTRGAGRGGVIAITSDLNLNPTRPALYEAAGRQ